MPSYPEETGQEREGRLAGSLTIFLAMCLTAILTLYFVLLGGVRRSAARMRLESVTWTACHSVLAEFQPELNKKYDLFMIDTGYGKGNPSLQKVQDRLLYYLRENCRRRGSSTLFSQVETAGLSVQSAQILAVRFAGDRNALAVREQVYAYMTADPAGTFLSGIITDTDLWRDLERSGRDREEEMDRNTEELQQAFQKGREDLTEESPPSEPEQMIEEVSSWRRHPLLRQIFGDTSSVSGAAVDTGALLSHRTLRKGDGITAANSHRYPGADGLLFSMYIGEKCGCFTGPAEDGPLRYEQEYILCGDSSDTANLEKTAARILLIREGANCLCLYSDKERRVRAEAVAAAVALVLFNPELKEPLTAGLMLGWAYVESLKDLRILFAGGKVPLRKEPAEWRSSLRELLFPDKKVSVSGQERGLSYEQYLTALLLLEGSTHRTCRTMDIMEMNIRALTANRAFMLDECIDTFRMQVQGSGRNGFSGTVQTETGYN